MSSCPFFPAEMTLQPFCLCVFNVFNEIKISADKLYIRYITQIVSATPLMWDKWKNEVFLWLQRKSIASGCPSEHFV